MQKWTTLPELDAPTGHGTVIEYFPERAGLVRVLGGGVWFWSDRERAWSELAKGLEMGYYHTFASYSAAAKVVLFGGGNGSRAVYALGRDGKVTARADAPVDLGIGRSLTVVDPATGELLALAKGGTFHAYDPATDRWRDLPADGLPSPKYDGHSVSAAPLAGDGVVLYFSSEPQGTKTLLCKHAARDGWPGRGSESTRAGRPSGSRFSLAYAARPSTSSPASWRACGPPCCFAGTLTCR